MKPNQKLTIGPMDLDWLAEALKLDDLSSEAPALERLLGSLPALRLEGWSKGAEILREGDTGDDFFVLRSGTVSIWRLGSGPKAQKVGTLKSGDFFGEIGFLLGGARSATVRAETDSRPFRFPAKELSDLLSKHDILDRWVKKVACARLEKLFRKD